MKFILILVFALLSVTLFSLSDYAYMFSKIEPSSLNRALGGNGIGVTNIWHNNALLSYSNPAIPAFHDGLAYGISENQWLEGNGMIDLPNSAGLMNLGYKGIGLTLPVPSTNGKSGIYLKYGNAPDINYDQAAVYGIAINPMRLIPSLKRDLKLPDNIEFAIGVNRKEFKSRWYVSSEEYFDPTIETFRGHTTDLGAIVKFINFTSNQINIEGVYGFAFFNSFNDKLDFFSTPCMIYRHRNHGLAFSVSKPPNDYVRNHHYLQFFKDDNLFTFRVMASLVDEVNYSDNTYGYGAELGALDTVFLRFGYYDDKDGHITGSSYGIGVNLHYKDLIAYTFNYASFPGGDLVDQQNSTDHNLSFNLVKFVERF